MVYELQHQPFKSLYHGYQSVTTYLVRIPYWTLRYAFRGLRPRPTWTFQMAFSLARSRLTSTFGPIAERIGQFRSWPTYLAIPDDPTVKSVWLDPLSNMIVGDVKTWAAAADVESVRIPGYWLDKSTYDTPVGEKPVSGEKVLYFIHGGGFLSESAHPSDAMASQPRLVLDQCLSLAAKRAFTIEYRNCEVGIPKPTNPFPAALVDCVIGYHYLSETVGFSPDDIIMMGDSAGANLIQALTRYLIDNRVELSAHITSLASSSSVASGLILLSPWTDLGTSHETPGSSALTNTCDFLPDLRTGLLMAVRVAYAGPLSMAGTNRNSYLSPASVHADMGEVSFKGFPRTFIAAGDADRLFDQQVTLRNKMVRDLGLGRAGVTSVECPDAIHGYLFVFPFSAEGRRTLAALDKWF